MLYQRMGSRPPNVSFRLVIWDFLDHHLTKQCHLLARPGMSRPAVNTERGKHAGDTGALITILSPRTKESKLGLMPRPPWSHGQVAGRYSQALPITVRYSTARTYLILLCFSNVSTHSGLYITSSEITVNRGGGEKRNAISCLSLRRSPPLGPAGNSVTAILIVHVHLSFGSIN